MSLIPPDSTAYAAFVLLDTGALPPYVDTALQQATDLLELATQGCLTAVPTDPLELRLYNNAITAMAEAIIGSRPYAATALVPVRAETIGSYSYERLLSSASASESTGVGWFDLAVKRFSCATTGENSSWSVSVFEREFQMLDLATGRGIYLGPADFEAALNGPWSANGTV